MLGAILSPTWDLELHKTSSKFESGRRTFISIKGFSVALYVIKCHVITGISNIASNPMPVTSVRAVFGVKLGLVASDVHLNVP